MYESPIRGLEQLELPKLTDIFYVRESLLECLSNHFQQTSIFATYVLTLWKARNFLSRNFFTKIPWNQLGKLLQWTHHNVEKFSLTKTIFRQINFLVISLVKLLLSRNFCEKCVRLNRSNFHTVLWKLH